MKKNILVLLVVVAIIQSCSPKIRTNITNDNHEIISTNSEIVILKLHEKLPEGSQFIGKLKIGDSGFTTNCGYAKVIEDAKETAKKSGSNLIHITEVKKPNFGSSCYRIKANLYRIDNNEIIAQLIDKKNKLNKSRLPADSDYAIVYFYRPKVYVGSLIGYKVRIDDETVIGRVRNGEKFEYIIKDFGKHKFWAKTESQTSVFIDVEKGQEYFVRCGINMGIVVGKPEMFVVQNELGVSEYHELSTP